MLPAHSLSSKLSTSSDSSYENGEVVKKLSNLSIFETFSSSDTSESSITPHSISSAMKVNDETLTLTCQTAVKLIQELAKTRDETSTKAASTYNSACVVYNKKALEFAHIALTWLEASRKEDAFTLIRAVLTSALPLQLDKALFTAFTSKKAIEEQVNGYIMGYLAKEIQATSKLTLFREDSGDLRLFRTMQSGYLSGPLQHIREQIRAHNSITLKATSSSSNAATCCAICLKRAVENDMIPQNLLKIYACMYRCLLEKYQNRKTSTLYIAQSVFLRTVNPFILNMEVTPDKQQEFSKKCVKITKHIQKACAETVDKGTLTRMVVREFAELLEKKLISSDPSVALLVQNLATPQIGHQAKQ